MKKLLPLSNIGAMGLNSDVQPWELPPEFISFGKNFRIDAGAIEASGGYAAWSTVGTNFYPGYIEHVGIATDDYWLVAGRTQVNVFDGNTWFDVSSAGGYTGLGVDDEKLWTGGMLGAIPILNNPQHFPEYWSPQSTGQPMQPLKFDSTNTWQAKGYSCKVMRTHKNFIFALNLREGSDIFPDGYRWSHPADINGLPFTWDENDLSGLASKESLGGDGGEIIDGLTLRDAFVIYSQRGIDVLDFTGDEFVFKRRGLQTTAGLLTTNCVVEVNGVHYYMSDGDILVNDGNKVKSIIHDRIKDRLNSSMNDAFYGSSFAMRNDKRKEVWFCIPEGDSETPNTAYIYNWLDDTWAVRDLPENITHAQYGAFTPVPQTWDTLTGTWDSWQGVWDSQSDSPLNDTIIGVSSASGSLVRLDPNTSDVDFNTTLERTDFPLEGHKSVTSISRVYPHFNGSGEVLIQFGSQDYAGSSVRWKPAITFNMGVDRKIDIRTTGELHCWRITSVGTTPFSMSGMDIEYSSAGER